MDTIITQWYLVLPKNFLSWRVLNFYTGILIFYIKVFWSGPICFHFPVIHIHPLLVYQEVNTLFVNCVLYFYKRCQHDCAQNSIFPCRVGDYILSINSTQLTGLTDGKVQQILRLLPRGLSKIVASAVSPDLCGNTSSSGQLFFSRTFVIYKYKNNT